MFEKKGSTGSSGKAYRFVGLRSITVNLFLLLILIIIFIVAVLIGPVYINPVTGVYIVASGVLEWIGSLIAGFSGANIAFFGRYSIAGQACTKSSSGMDVSPGLLPSYWWVRA